MELKWRLGTPKKNGKYVLAEWKQNGSLSYISVLDFTCQYGWNSSEASKGEYAFTEKNTHFERTAWIPVEELDAQGGRIYD